MNDKKKLFGILALLTIFIVIMILLNSLKNKAMKSVVVKPLEDNNALIDIQYILNNLYTEEYPLPSYMPIKIDYAENGLKKVYFVNGYLLEGDNYTKDVNYVVVVDGIYYGVEKIDEPDIKKYEKEYFETHNIKDIYVDDSFTLPSINYNENYKLSLYINNFNTLMEVDKEKAYSLLSKEDQKHYGSADNISTDNIVMTSNIKDVDKNEKGKKTTYQITDYDNNKITIFENKLLDYEIEVK